MITDFPYFTDGAPIVKLISYAAGWALGEICAQPAMF